MAPLWGAGVGGGQPSAKVEWRRGGRAGSVSERCLLFPEGCLLIERRLRDPRRQHYFLDVNSSAADRAIVLRIRLYTTTIPVWRQAMKLFGNWYAWLPSGGRGRAAAFRESGCGRAGSFPSGALSFREVVSSSGAAYATEGDEIGLRALGRRLPPAIFL